MSDYKVIYFDMDGTLIRNTNSVEYLCKLHGKSDEYMNIEAMENRNEITWVEADFAKCKLLKGLRQAKIHDNFDKNIKIILGLDTSLKHINNMGMKAILVTAGPIDVASVLVERFNFDAVSGSEYEIEEGIYTGRITKHLDGKGKLDALKEFCEKNNASLNECVAVGDSASDLDVFKNCGMRIAINYSSSLLNKADVYIRTEDLKKIIPFINSCD